MSVSLSLVVVTINVILRLIVLRFTTYLKLYSHTQFYASYINRYFLFYFFNSAFLPYLVHGMFDRDNKELLIIDIHFICLASALATPACKLVDPVYLLNLYYIRKYKLNRKGLSKCKRE